MVKLFALLPKREDVTEAYFHEHWRTTHKDHALNMRRLRRYVQGHRVEPQPEGFPPAPFEGFEAAPFEGIAEAWFENLGEALEMGEDPDYVAGAKQDEPNFMDIDRTDFLVTTENVVIAGPTVAQDDPGTKLVLLLRRAPGLDKDAFHDRWNGGHAKLMAKLPGLTRYVQSGSVPESYAEREPPFDGVGELWFADLVACRAALDSAEMEAVRGDLDSLIGPGSAAQLEYELRFIWP